MLVSSSEVFSQYPAPLYNKVLYLYYVWQEALVTLLSLDDGIQPLTHFEESQHIQW